jgi:hypothetical protein
MNNINFNRDISIRRKLSRIANSNNTQLSKSTNGQVLVTQNNVISDTLQNQIVSSNVTNDENKIVSYNININKENNVVDIQDINDDNINKENNVVDIQDVSAVITIDQIVNELNVNELNVNELNVNELNVNDNNNDINYQQIDYPNTKKQTISENNNFDKINLNSIDVILDVIKPYKNTSNINDDHTFYTDILTLFPDATVDNTKVYMINYIEPPPVILNINNNSSLVDVNRINKSAVKLSSDIPFNVGSINKIKVNLKRSNIPTLSSFIEAPILNVDFIIDSDVSKKLQKYISYNFYPVNPNIMSETYYYFNTETNIVRLFKHSSDSLIDTVVSSNDLNNSLMSGLYYFNNGNQPDGYLINLIYSPTLDRYYLNNAACIQTSNKIQLYISDNGLGDKYMLKAKNNIVDVTDTTFAKAEIIKSKSHLTVGITKNNKLYEINTNGIAICPTNINNIYKISIGGILRLCYASLNSILTIYSESIYIYDSNNLNSSYQKLLCNTSTGISQIQDGYYMIGPNATLNDNFIQINGSNISIYQRLLSFINGKINYIDFGITYSSTNNLDNLDNLDSVNVLNTGTIFFNDEPQPFTVPTSFNAFTTIIDKAIQLDPVLSVTNSYYIGPNGALYNLYDDSVVTSLNGVYIVNGVDGNNNRYYEINNQTGIMTLYNGLVYTNFGLYNTVLNGIATPLEGGVYIDNNNRVISVGISGEWNVPDTGLPNDYIKINIPNDSFIIRKIIYQTPKDIYLLQSPDDYTKSDTIINIEGKLYNIVSYNNPVVLVTNKYVKDSDNKLYFSDQITGELTIADNNLYSWATQETDVIYQINNGNIYWIKDGSNFNFFDTTINYPLFIERLLDNKFGKLYSYNTLLGSLLPVQNGQYFLTNIKENNKISSLLSFDSIYKPVNNGDTFNFYYKITSEYNGPVTNNVLVNLSRTFILNENGCSNTDITLTPIYIVKPDSSLEYWDGINQITSGANVQNKCYIGYDDKLSKTLLVNNERNEIIMGNYWVRHNDTTYKLYIDSIAYTPLVGTIISVNSNNKNKRNIAENGLKIYSVDKSGIVKWSSLVVQDVSNISTGQIVDIIPYYFIDPPLSNKTFAQVHSSNVQNTITVNVILANSDEHADAPQDPIINSGVYYYNTSDNKLYKEISGVWSALFDSEYFIRADGKVYISTNNTDAITYEGNIGAFIKTPLNLYRISTIGTTGFASSGLGAEMSQIGSTTWCYDSSNNKLYYGNNEIKIAINISATLTDLNECVVAPPNPTTNSGIYYYNTTDNKLYKEFNGLWTSIFLPIYFIRADGKIYVSASNSDARAYVGVLNSLVQVQNNGVVAIITSIGTDSLASSGLGATIVEKYKSPTFLINVNTTSDKLYTITTNAPISTTIQPNSWVQLSTRVIKVCPNNVVNDDSPIIWSKDPITYNLNNDTGLFRFYGFYILLKQSNNTLYTIRQSSNLPPDQYYNEVFVVDGIVQNESAPKGTVIYTDSGIFIRTGYSQTQINSGINDIAKDSWYNGSYQTKLN